IEKLRAYWVGVSTVVINAETGATQKATAAQIAYNVAKKASKGIIGLIVVAISALVAAMVAVTKIQEKRAAQVIKEMSMSDEQIEMYKQLTQAQKKSLETTAQEVVSAEILFKALAKTNEGSKERKKSINDINTAYGTYLPNLLTEKSSLTDIAAAHWLIVDGIKAKLQAEVAVEAAKTYVQRGAQLQAEKKNYEDQVKLINDYNRAMQDYQTRAQAGTLKPFELAPELPAQVATLGTAYQALEKIEPKLEAVTTAIAANNSAMNAAISSAATATAGLNLLTYAHENENKTNEKGNEIYGVKEFLTHEQIESILQLMETRKESNKVLSETEQLELEEAETMQKAGEAVQQLMENIRNSQPVANEFLDWWKSLTDLEKAKNIVDLFSKLTGVVSDFSEISDENGKKEVENFKVQQDEKLRVLNERLRLGFISEEQYIADKSDLELEFEAKKKEIEKREFERKKKLAYAEAVINGASAAISALKEKTLAMKVIALAFVALTLAAQLSKISSSSPGYAKGRKDGPGEWAKVGEQGWEY
ncbi:MAG TPA: hypothetical protein PKL96_11840, partial [Bacteroidales bacterium]|nr:hypothetical protein [Bacteroidales bacterium]